jgi:hypothetical protein
MDEPGGHYTKWYRSGTERQTLQDLHLYVEPKKKIELTEL